MSNWIEFDDGLYNIDSFRKIEIVCIDEERRRWSLRGYYTVPRPGIHDEDALLDEYTEYEELDYGTENT